MNNQPTPETDALVPQFLNGGEVPDIFAHCRKLERERDEARKAAIALIEKGCDRECAPLYYAQRLERERDEARDDAAYWKSEYEIVVARLCGVKHKRDNGIIFEHEIIPKLERERDELKEQLGQAMEIAEDFCGLVCYGMGWSGKEWSVENMRDARRTINWFQRLQEAVTE